MVIENNRLREEDILNTAKGEARREGWKEGMEQGMEQGMEGNKIDVVKKMLLNKLDYEIISNVTGKTLEEIKEIENKI